MEGNILKKIWEQLNFVAQCKKYGLSIWQCPSFLFIILGAIVISAILITYRIATDFTPDPQVAALIVLSIAGVLFAIGHMIVSSFYRLAAAMKARSEFISIASHELRSPITNIKWMLSILMKDGAADSMSTKHLEQLRIIKDNNQRMTELVNDLLVASRVDQGRLDLRPEKYDLGQAITDIIREYQYYAQANNASLQTEIDPDLPMTFVDSLQIKLVLRHLLDNSIKYLHGPGWVKVRLKKKGQRIRCEVEDNGVGIPKKDQVRIFEKFFRSSNAKRYQTQGTGLGLFIANAVIKTSGGRIGFKSTENKGTTFYFELPINK